MKEGRKEGWMEGRMEGRKEGWKEGRNMEGIWKEGRNMEGREGGRKHQSRVVDFDVRVCQKGTDDSFMPLLRR